MERPPQVEAAFEQVRRRRPVFSPPGGRLADLGLPRLIDDDRLFDLFREAWTELRGSEEFEDLFARAGFRVKRVLKLPSLFRVFELEAAGP